MTETLGMTKDEYNEWTHRVFATNWLAAAVEAFNNGVTDKTLLLGKTV